MGEFRLGRAYQYGVGIPIISVPPRNGTVARPRRAIPNRPSLQNTSATILASTHLVQRAGEGDYGPLPDAALDAAPTLTGRVFHNVNQRLAYFEAWAHNAAAYTACVSAHVNRPPRHRLPLPGSRVAQLRTE